MADSKVGAQTPSRETTGLVATALLGILAGTAVQIALGFAGALPDVDPSGQYQSFVSNRLLYYGYGWAFAFFGLVVIAFIVALASILRHRSPTVASAASALGVVGAFLIAFAANFYVGALASIQAAAGAAPGPADATYQAAIISNVSNFSTVFGWLGLGISLLLLGWLIHRSGLLPDWLRLFAYVGGAAALTPFLIGAVFPFASDTPGFPWFSNPGFPIADTATGFALTLMLFLTAIVLLYRVRPNHLLLPGIILIVLGVALFPPYQSVALLFPFFLLSGAILVWLSRRRTVKPAVAESTLE